MIPILRYLFCLITKTQSRPVGRAGFGVGLLYPVLALAVVVLLGSAGAARAAVDVTVTLTGPAVVYSGTATGNFTVTFSNVGDAPATITVRRVTLPTGSSLSAGQVTALQAAYPGFTYNTGNRRLDFGTALLAGGASNVFNFPFTPQVVNTSGSIQLTANITTSTAQTGSLTDNATLNTTNTPVADLSVVVQAAPASVNAGATSATYTVRSANAGPSRTNGSTLEARLLVNGAVPPAGTVVAGLNNGGTYDAGTGIISWTVGSINSGNTADRPFSIQVPNSTAGGSTISIQVAGTATSTDFDATNNDGSVTNPTLGSTANWTTIINAAADVQTFITAAPTTGTSGSTVTFTQTIRNNGPQTATNIVPTFLLQLNGAPLAASAVPANVGYTYDAGTGLLTYTTLATLNNTSTTTRSVTVTVPAATPNNAALTVRAAATASSSDGDATNNNGSITTATLGTTANWTTTISNLADVTTTLGGTTQLLAGQQASLTVTFSNAGPSVAAGTVRTVALPAAATAITATGGTISGTNITYPGGDLAPGAPVSFTITFTLPATAPATYTASSAISTTTSQGALTQPDNASVTLSRAGAPFTCNSAFYRIQLPTTGAGSILQRLDRTTTSTSGLVYTATNLYNTGFDMNALSLNFADGYLYAFGLGTNRLYRLSATGNVVQDMGLVAGLPTSGFNSASADLNGNIYLGRDGLSVIYRLNVATLAVTTITLTPAVAIFGDVGYNPADGFLYGTRYYNTTGTNGLYRVNPSTGAVTVLGTPATSGGGSQDVGSIFFDAAGTLYAATNQGSLVLFDTTDGTVTAVGSASSATQSDGASCVFPTNDIDVVLSATAPLRVNATTFDIPFTVRVRNSGAVSNPNVQINDFLAEAFPTATSITVSGLAVANAGGAALVANPAFTGTGINTALLSGTVALGSASTISATITYTVRVAFPVGAVPTIQYDQVYASTASVSPNNGYTLINGAYVPPSQVLAVDLSSNSLVLPTTPGGDTPLPTPFTFSQPIAADNVFNTPNNTTLAAAAATSVTANDTPISPNTISNSTVDLTPGGALNQANVPAVTGSGQFSVNANGQISYIPGTPTFTGVATIQYTVRDNGGNVSNPATISVNVGPQTANDVISTAYNAAGSTAASVTANDTDANGFDLTTLDLNPGVAGVQSTFDFVSGGNTVGTFSAAANGVVTYTPATGSLFTGTPTATYRILDGLTGNQALSSIGTITVTLTNTAPVATTGLINVAVPASTTTPVVLNPNLSGTDAEGNATIASFIVNPPSSGTLRFNGITVAANTVVPANQLNLLTYQPVSTFVGNAIFFFAVRDNVGATGSTTTYTIPVSAVADVATTLTGPTGIPPGAATGNYTATFSNGGPSTAASVTRQVTLPPGSTVTAAQLLTITTAYPTATYNSTTRVLDFGTLTTLNSGVSNSFVFAFTAPTTVVASTPLTSAVTTTTNQGADTGPNSATLNLRVNAPPVANNVSFISMTTQAPATAITALSATDSDGSIASFTILTVPSAGQGQLLVNGVGINPSGFAGLTITPTQATQLSFDPAGSQYGNFTFTYSATDNDGGVSNTATYTVRVTNVAPTANSDQNDVPLNTPTSGNVLLNDVDPELGVLTVNTTPTVAPTRGTVTLAANGSYTYTPNTGYLGPDTFSYQVCDNGSLCSSASVTIRVYNPLTACVSGTGNNILTNPSFTSGNTGFVTTLTYVPSPATPGQLYPEDTYTVTADVAPFHAAFSGTGRTGAGDNFMAINASPQIKVMYQQTMTVQPNRYYTFSAYFKNLITNRNIAVPQVGFVINGQSTSGIVTIPEEAAAGPANVWIKFSDIWFSGSNTTATFEIRNLTIDRNGNDLGIDDIYFGTCNLPPFANADIRNTPPATPITFNITANDTDGDGTIVPATIILTGSAPGTPRSFTDSFGNTFVVDAAGNLTFTPVPTFFGIASATYTVQDNNGATSNPGVISVTVQAPLVDVQTVITSPASNSAIIAGQPTTATIVTTNNSTSATGYDVVQSLELRPGLAAAGLLLDGSAGTLSGSTITFGGGATYNVLTGVLTLPALPSLAPTATATYTVTFPAPGSGPLALTAVVTHDALDAVPANNVFTANLLVDPRFDLVTTVSGPTSIVTGNQVTFFVTTANNSTSVSAGDNVVQTAQFPANLVQVFVSNGGMYDAATGLVTWPAVNNLAPGQRLINTVAFDAPSAGFTATSTVTPNTLLTGETVVPTNSATAPATTVSAPVLTQRADPFVSIRASAHYVAPGTPVNLTVAGGNHGPDGALGVGVTIHINPGLTFTNLGGATYDSNAGLLTFGALSRPTGPLIAGDSTTYVLTLLAPTVGPVLAAAVVTSTTRDEVANNNFMSTKIDVFTGVDLAITLAAPATASAGEAVLYTVTTTNQSGAPARNLDQTLQLPPNLGSVAVSGGGTYNVGTGIVTFPAIASLAVGASQSYSVRVTAPSDISTLRAVAAVASSTPETQYTNNVATALTTLSPAADVRITISGPATGIINSPVSYVVTTTNFGPSVAASTTPTVQLPRNLILINLPTGATYVPATGLLTFPTIQNLPANGSSATAFTVVMPDVARLVPTATATVTAATNDRNLTNNFASFSTIANAPTDQIADLAATVSVTSGGTPVTAATPSQSLTFAATYTNNGIDPAFNVAPRLALPSGLVLANVVISNGGAYNSSTGLVTWPVEVGPFAVGASLAYTVTFPAPAAGPVVATAIVSSSISDNVLANNVASTSVTINAQVDVISRVVGPATVQPGESATYTITTSNNGPSSATAVQTTVTLPAGISNLVIPAGATVSGNDVLMPIDNVQTPGVNGQQSYLISFTPPTATPWQVSTTATTATTETNTTNNGQSVSTSRANLLPTATNVVNSMPQPIGNTATTPRAISPPVGADTDGTIVRFTLAALPPSTQGTLYVNGVPLAGLTFTLAQANQLSFLPAPGFSGNVFLTYTSTDNASGVSVPALYTLPIGRDNDSYYTYAPVLGGTVAYQNGDNIAVLYDANGGEYVGANVVDTGTRSVVYAAGSATLPPGTALDPVTGRVYVSDRNLLVAGTYTINVTSTDVYSGQNNVPVVFTIGANPLPVELRTFTARASGLDGVLAWTTASEKNNAYFAVERSRDGGRTFAEIGRRTGAGSTPVPQEYALTDGGVGRTAGTVYYRLRQVDTDGKFSFSDVRAIAFTGGVVGGPLTAYPNPVAGGADATLKVAFEGQVAGRYALTLYDAAGRAVLTATHAVGAGAEAAQLAVGTLPAGTYTLRVTSAEGYDSTLRVVRQ